TAARSRLCLLPAPPDTGIVFRRVDLDNFEIEAHVRNVARVSYATSLMKKGVLLATTEHLLAALYSCGVDNVYIELDALEVPILDGSSQPFVRLLQEAGLRKLRHRRRYLKVLRPLEVSEGDTSGSGQDRSEERRVGKEGRGRGSQEGEEKERECGRSREETKHG